MCGMACGLPRIALREPELLQTMGPEQPGKLENLKPANALWGLAPCATGWANTPL